MVESLAASQKMLGNNWCKITAIVCAALLAVAAIALGVVLSEGSDADVGSNTVPRNKASNLNDWGLNGALNCEVPAANKGRYSVVVIGAGVSGLSAAHQLMRRGICDVLVVEALDRMGGRVKQIEGIASWPLEGGAELIHGEDSIVRQLTKSDQKGIEMPTRPREVVNYVFWADTDELVSLETGVPELNDVYEVINAAYDDFYNNDFAESDPSLSVLDMLKTGGISDNNVRVLDIAEASIANEQAADLKTMSVEEMVWGANNYLDGEQDFVKEGTFKPLVDWLAEDVPVRLGWPVVKVEWEQNSGAWVIGADGESVRADAVVTSVPLTQLKKNAIHFSPALPKSFQDMVDKITVNNAVKVFAYFENSFWKHSIHAHKFEEGDGFQGMYSPGTNFPQIWVSSNPNRSSQHSAHTVITAFVHNRYADVLSGLGEEEAVAELLDLLDRVFKRPGSSSQQVGLATQSFLKGGMMDWSQEPYIEAGYSSPSLGVGAGDRQVLGSVDGGVLFFAGEHTNVYVNAALQGSMETGRRAAENVAAALKEREES